MLAGGLLGVVAKPKQKTGMTLDAVLAQMTKQYGEGALFLGKTTPSRDVPAVSTGSMLLDHATGIGGMPLGRVVEYYGGAGAGKTSLTLHTIASAQRQGLTCAFIDAEHALDPRYAEALGVDFDKLLVSQPDSGEQALDICESLVTTGAVKVIVIDSVAALTPRAELDGEIGQRHMALQARLMSQGLRMLCGPAAKNGCLLIFINQTRMNIGVTFGSPVTTTGGNALKFYASMRLQLSRIGSVKQGDRVIGNRTRIKVVKNKFAPPFREIETEIRFGRGIYKAVEILDKAVEFELIKKGGAWFTMPDGKRLQGRERVLEYLAAEPAVAEELEAKVSAKLD